MTLHHRPADRLFATGSGTSYAAPLVAFKAAQVLARFPSASANLIRALLVSSATIPAEALDRLSPLPKGAAQAVCGHGRVNVERASYSDDGRVVLYADDTMTVDQFAVFRIPIPEVFKSTRGRRIIRVTLAYDPPVRHTRSDYAGVSMNFRLVRGCEPSLIFAHYRKRLESDGEPPEIDPKYACKLKPGPRARERGTVQTACATFHRNVSDYRDPYYLVVRCEGGWGAYIASQRFAVLVELAHEAEVPLYAQIRQRLRV